MQTIHHAAQSGDLKELQEILKQGVEIDFPDEFGHTPLHLACKEGHIRIVKFLLKQGADPNARDKRANTPLHLAVAAFHLKTVKLLLKYGSDVNTLNDNDDNACSLALANAGQEKILEMLGMLTNKGGRAPEVIMENVIDDPLGELRIPLSKLKGKDLDKRIQRAYSRICDAVDNVKCLSKMNTLSPGQKMLYTTTTLEGEVNNGGFEQYFQNSSGDDACDALEGLKLVGAQSFFELLQKAMTVFPIENYPRDWEERNAILERLCDGEDSSLNILDDLDDRFHKLSPTLDDYRKQYIQSHLDEFFINDIENQQS